MTGPFFVDTNVFVYAIDDRDPVKQATARTFLAENPDHIVISSQVCAEFYRVATDRIGLSAADALDVVEDLSYFRSVTTDLELVLDACRLAGRASLSIWDAMIVRAAARGGCRTLITEDLSHGSEIEGIAIRDPFRTS